MKKLALVVVAAAAVLAGCGGASSAAPGSADGGGVGAAASCVGPILSIAPHRARPGDTVDAAGEWFAADCYDTGQAGTPPPLTGLTLQVSQRGQTWTVASGIDAAGDHYAFHVPITLPADLQPGAATVAVKGYGEAGELTVTAG